MDLFQYVEAFFRDYPDTAFTLEEILRELEEDGRRATTEEVVEALTNLTQRDRVGSTEVREMIYYIYIRRPLGFRTR